ATKITEFASAWGAVPHDGPDGTWQRVAGGAWWSVECRSHHGRHQLRWRVSTDHPVGRRVIDFWYAEERRATRQQFPYVGDGPALAHPPGIPGGTWGESAPGLTADEFRAKLRSAVFLLAAALTGQTGWSLGCERRLFDCGVSDAARCVIE